MGKFHDAFWNWFWYNLTTVLICISLYGLQVAVGSFIRWEAGTNDLQIAIAKDPVAALAQGWTEYNCFPAPAPTPGQVVTNWSVICGFVKAH